MATCAVAVGTTISAFWILAANSWMQTPQGHGIDAEGKFYPISWMEIIFNPSFPPRYVHMMLGAAITTAAVILAAGAWQTLRNHNQQPTRWQMRMAAGTLMVLMPLQIWAGHWSGEVAHHYQPAKIAAIEGWWETKADQSTILFAIPDEKTKSNKFELALPGVGNIIMGVPQSEVIQGLKDFEGEHPPVFIVFWSFRIMVGTGMIMLLLGIWGCFKWWRGTIDKPGLFHWIAVPSGTLGFIAVITGWIVAEVGRQPYTVYGLLRTEDSLSPVTTGQVATSLLFFMTAYAIIFTAGIVYMFRIATAGYNDKPTDGPKEEGRAPGSPLGSVDDASVPGKTPTQEA